MRGSAAFRAAVAPGGVLAGPWVRNELWRRARAVPSLDLRFAETKSLVDSVSGQNLITFTRASTGTYVDSDGVIRSAATNLLLRSEEFDNASWTKARATVSQNTAVAPNGSVTADTIVEDTTSNSHIVLQGVSGALSATAYTASVYVKANVRSRVRLALFGTANTSLKFVDFDLSTGAILGTSGATGTILPSTGDGWFRCSVTTTTNSAGTVELYVWTLNDAGSSVYLGTGANALDVWGAQLEVGSTATTYIPTGATINSAPRFDHNPLTGECLGLLVEEQRTNSIRNNTMQGAVAGTPGTLPTNWGYFAVTTGLTASIVGTGVESGINYIDLRLNGTAGSTSPSELAIDPAVAATGQIWTFSTYWRLVAGSTAGISSFGIGQIELNSSAVFVAGAFVSQATPTSSGLQTQRPSLTRTLSGGATVAFVDSRIRITPVNGAAIDITLRIGLPQLEQGAFATSVIPTTGTAGTRTADVASISGTNFSSWYRQDEGCVFVDGSAQNVLAAAGGFLLINDPAGGNRVDIRQYRTQPIVQGGGGSALTWAGPVMPSIAANAFYRQAMAYSATADNHANAISGVVEKSTTSLDNILANRLALFMRDAQTAPTGGTGGIIRRIACWPQRLPDSTLQSITL